MSLSLLAFSMQNSPASTQGAVAEFNLVMSLPVAKPWDAMQMDASCLHRMPRRAMKPLSL
jgi:hypothetical protein